MRWTEDRISKLEQEIKHGGYIELFRRGVLDGGERPEEIYVERVKVSDCLDALAKAQGFEFVFVKNGVRLVPRDHD